MRHYKRSCRLATTLLTSTAQQCRLSAAPSLCFSSCPTQSTSNSRLLEPKLLIQQCTRTYRFITTPIFYVNGAPHIGHLYSALLGDVSYRWELLHQRDPVPIFTSGTDEHGVKVQSAANVAGLPPKQFCDQMTVPFMKMFERFEIKPTNIVRTSDDQHKTAVAHLWNILRERGFISKSEYSGWYCPVEECFYADADVTDCGDYPNFRMTTISGHPVHWVQEPNYVFELHKVYDKLRDWLTNSDVIQPSIYLPFILTYMKNDRISISRDSQRVAWGIPVPGDQSQTIYVWFDALINYLTAAGYPNERYQDVWPPDCQFVGKDIIRFHAILWPAMLMAADLPLPTRLSIHGHWLSNGYKMSKSVGNVVDPFKEADVLTVDGLRYFLLRQGVMHEDANYELTRAIRICNAELANSYGNLLKRSTGVNLNATQTYLPIDWDVFNNSSFMERGQPLVDMLNVLTHRVSHLYEQQQFYRAIDHIQSVLHQANAFFDDCQPWRLIKLSNDVGKPGVHTCLALCYETLRLVSILLQPVVPNVSNRVLTCLNVPVQHRTIRDALPFERAPNPPTGRCINPQSDNTYAFVQIKDENNNNNSDVRKRQNGHVKAQEQR